MFHHIPCSSRIPSFPAGTSSMSKGIGDEEEGCAEAMGRRINMKVHNVSYLIISYLTESVIRTEHNLQVISYISRRAVCASPSLFILRLCRFGRSRQNALSSPLGCCVDLFRNCSIEAGHSDSIRLLCDASARPMREVLGSLK